VRDYSAANSFLAPKTSGVNSLVPLRPVSSRFRSRLVVVRSYLKEVGALVVCLH
jgi:hypothetical protein